MPNLRPHIALTPAEQLAFLESQYTLQVATNGPQGYPHMVAMWFAVIDGLVHFATRSKSQKIVNLRRDPKITVMVESGRAYDALKGLVIQGTAELIDDTDAVCDIMMHVSPRYAGATGSSAAARAITREALMVEAAKRTAIRVHPVNVFSWDHGKMAAAQAR
ncbi:MAG: TIGR03618 family F420-dependent PPOX class oxidoreductase [Gammaproteobacteria bacterium]